MVIYKFNKSETNTSGNKKQSEFTKTKTRKRKQKQNDINDIFETIIDFIFDSDFLVSCIIISVIALGFADIMKTSLEKHTSAESESLLSADSFTATMEQKHTDYTIIDEIIVDSENQDIIFSPLCIFAPEYEYDLYIGKDLIAEGVESYWPAYKLCSLEPGQSETYDIKVKVRYVWMDENEECGEYKMKVTINK